MRRCRLPQDIFTNDLCSKLKFWGKFTLLWFNHLQSNCHKCLHMSWQHSCHDMYKISKWWLNYNLDESRMTMKFISNSNCNRKLSKLCKLRWAWLFWAPSWTVVSRKSCMSPSICLSGKLVRHVQVQFAVCLCKCQCNFYLWHNTPVTIFVVGLCYGSVNPCYVPNHCQISHEFGSWMLHWPICFNAYASRVLGYLTYQITNPTMHLSFIPQCVTLRQIHAHFCSRLMHCGVWNRCIVGFER